MKKLIIPVLLAWSVAFPAVSQSPAEGEERGELNVIERIEQESGGNVEIDIPDNIVRELLKGEQQQQQHNEPSLRPGINKVAGYRIQVFGDGHNQHSLESRAKARGNAVVAKFPKYRGQVYSFSSSPNWYTRVGNFRTSAEASAALSELKRAFPQFASEIRIVKSQIVIIR